MVHLALAAQTRPFTPPWLKEGVIVYFSGDLSLDVNRALVRQGLGHLSLERMTRAGTLGEHDLVGRQSADEYLFAGNVVAYLVEKHGQQSLLDLYRSYGDRSVAGIAAKTAADALARPESLVELLEGVAGGGARGALAAELTEEALERRYGLSVQSLETAVKGWLAVPHQ